MALIQKAFSDIITFSRSSNATRVGPTGLVEYAPHNLLTYSEQFDNAAWGKSKVGNGVIPVVTTNTSVAPDGTVTADTVVFTAPDSGDRSILGSNPTTTAGTYTGSIYIKATGATDVGKIIGFRHVASGPFTLITLTNSWQRVTASETRSGNNFEINLRPDVGTSSGTVSVQLWGAQLSVGPYPLDYTPTTSAAVYGPRFDYDPVTLAARGLLVEEQRTNLITYSEQFDNAAWTKARSTVTANAATSPDGTVTADSIIEDTTANDSHCIFQSASLGAGTYTASCYFKKSTRSFACLRISTDGDTKRYAVTINLDTGEFGSSDSNGSPTNTAYTITNFGNGWYRLSVTATHSAGLVYATIAVSNAAIPTYGSALPLYTGNGTSGILVWGAQLEAGSFATSLIPTLASTVTRSADVASVNTLSPWHNSVEGTLYGEGDFISNTAGASGVVALGDGTTNENIAIFKLTNVQSMAGEILDGGASQASFTQSFSTQVVKSAFAYKVNDFNMATNGTAGTTDTSGTLPTITTMFLGSIYSATSFPMNGHLRRIAFYPRRLTNAEIVALTA